MFRTKKPDPHKARNLYLLGEERLADLERTVSPSLLVERYFDTCKEFIGSILAISGIHIIDQKSGTEYLQQSFDIDHLLLEELRKLRNRLVYEGVFIDQSFLDRNRTRLDRLVHTLRRLAGSLL